MTHHNRANRWLLVFIVFSSTAFYALVSAFAEEKPSPTTLPTDRGRVEVKLKTPQSAEGGILTDNLAANPGRADELAKLKHQQIELFRRGAAMANSMFAHDVGSIADAIRWRGMLLDAELASASTAKERQKLLHEALTAAKELEDLAGRKLLDGTANQLATLEAKAWRLGIEVSLAELNP